jgi:hypothetical protein
MEGSCWFYPQIKSRVAGTERWEEVFRPALYDSRTAALVRFIKVLRASWEAFARRWSHTKMYTNDDINIRLYRQTTEADGERCLTIMGADESPEEHEVNWIEWICMRISHTNGAIKLWGFPCVTLLNLIRRRCACSRLWPLIHPRFPLWCPGQQAKVIDEPKCPLTLEWKWNCLNYAAHGKLSSGNLIKTNGFAYKYFMANYLDLFFGSHMLT